MLECARLLKGCASPALRVRDWNQENALKISKNHKAPGQLILHTAEGNAGKADRTNRPPERYKYRHEERGA